MRKSVIISIVYPPTTPAFSHPSFPKEGNGDTTDWLNYHQIWRRILFLLFYCNICNTHLYQTLNQRVIGIADTVADALQILYLQHRLSYPFW